MSHFRVSATSVILALLLSFGYMAAVFAQQATQVVDDPPATSAPAGTPAAPANSRGGTSGQGDVTPTATTAVSATSAPAAGPSHHDAAVQPLAAGDIVLTSDGTAGSKTITYPESAAFAATGPWTPGDSTIYYYIFKNADLSCGGTPVSQCQLTASSLGIASLSFLPPQAGTYSVLVRWMADASDCFLLTVLPPVISLTSDGSPGPKTVAYLQATSFTATRDWAI